MQKIVNSSMGFLPVMSRILAGLVAALWYTIEPSLSFFYVCVFAVVLDCITAWRLNRRIRRTYSAEVADGKLKSSHMSKMITDLMVVFACIVFADLIDRNLLAHLGNLHLASYIAAIFCGVEFVSILENESSCNGKPWAKLCQQFLQDKTKRHLQIDEETFEKYRKIFEGLEKNGASGDNDSDKGGE